MNDPSILLVDDDEVFRNRLARAFRERGFDVRVAANYDEGRTSALEDSPEEPDPGYFSEFFILREFRSAALDSLPVT